MWTYQSNSYSVNINMNILRKLYNVFHKGTLNKETASSDHGDSVKTIQHYIELLFNEVNEQTNGTLSDSDTKQCTFCGFDQTNPHITCMQQEDRIGVGHNKMKNNKGVRSRKVKKNRKTVVRGKPDPPKTPWFGEVESFRQAI